MHGAGAGEGLYHNGLGAGGETLPQRPIVRNLGYNLHLSKSFAVIVLAVKRKTLF